jgi:glycosyltransferase involved in cell wall biosynthesis
MKILFVSPFLPSPPRFGGQRRLDGLARELARKHEVSFVAFNRADEHMDLTLDTTRSYCKEVVFRTEPNPDGTRDKRTLQLRSLASLKSYEYLNFSRRVDFQVALDEMLETRQFDVVQYEFCQMAPFTFRRLGPKPPVFVLDEHNIEYDVLKRTASASRQASRLVYNAVNWRKLAAEERSAWRLFDGITFTSKRDQEFVAREVPSARTAVIPNGVDVDTFAISEAPVEPGTILFFGAINYFPNEDGVVYFVDEILPRVRAERASTRFLVLGPGAHEPVLSRSGNGVEILGMVDDVGPYIDRAEVVVVPLRIGGGTRLKIVEALSKGKAVISTRLGAEGIDVEHEKNILLADDPESFAKAVSRVLGDPELRQRLGREGRKLMEERYSWRTITGDLVEFYRELGAGS